MDGKTLRARSLAAQDQKLALWVIGKANFENLAAANRQVYVHPIVVAVWILFSLLFVHFMDWWPSSTPGVSGILGFLLPLPAFASVAVPIMFLIDWWDLTHNNKEDNVTNPPYRKNRPDFERRTQEIIKEKDLNDPLSYYSKSPASGFWIFEFGESFVGLIALDANDAKDTRKALIRHFFVHESYRKTGIQADILDHALKHAFNRSPTIESVEAVDTPALVPYIHECLKDAKFQPLKDHRPIGIFDMWRYNTVCLQRKDFQK